MKKALSLILALAMVLSMAAFGSSVAESTVTDFVVTTLTYGENEVLVCYPTPNVADTIDLKRSCTAPIILVFGEGKYDEESAKAYALESGLAAIAANEGGSVCFVNPVGDAWSEADAEVYGTIIGSTDDSSTSDIANGISTSSNYFTGEVVQAISGSNSRAYIYGIGAGADFVASNFVKPVVSSVTYGDGVTMTFDRTATAITLVGATTATGIEANDMTVMADGCSDEVVAALQAACGAVIVSETADFTAEYAQAGAYRRQAGVLVPVFDWAAEGITEVVESYEVTTSADNVTFAGTEKHTVNYVTYYAADADVAGGSLPLVLCFHGGGNTALYEAQATQWPLIGKARGFITVSVDLHYPNVTAAETVELIQHLEEEYSIDASRIYASGFSMGGVKSWDLYEQYPTLFAGLAPMDATNEVGTDSFSNPVENYNTATLVPTFWVGGEASPLPEMPFQAEKCVARTAYLFQVNQVVKAYDCSFDAQDAWENPIWGVNGDLTYQVTATDFTDSTMTIELFASADGKYYTALACAGNQSHEVYARNSWAAYDFLSQFSRAEDGSIVISDVTYSMPADDGSVTDNSYNK